MPLDKFPLVVKEFKGILLSDIDTELNSFGDVRQISIPFEYALESQNLEYLKKGGMRTRNGIDRYVELLNIVGKPQQMWKIDLLQGTQQTDRWLILTWDGATGRLYDTGVTAPATNPIKSLAGMKYAFVLNAFGRMYITPWSAWANPLDSDFVYVYNGLYNVRLTKGNAPAVGAFAVAAAAGGNVTVGLHYVSVLFETDTGYITICPSTHLTTPLSVTTTTANATINGTNVPVGAAGSGVIKRHIIITKVVVNPNGQGLRGYEPFIVITINDNTTTTFSFNQPDSSFTDSAKDYIEDNNTIPACVSLATLGNRLVYVAPEPTPTTLQDAILVSPPSRPEQINTTFTPLGAYFVIETESTVRIGPDFSGKPMCAAELNRVLYVFKEDSTFAVIANDETDPNEWEDPQLIDGGKGAFPYGLCRVGNNPGFMHDGNILVAGNHGITYFNGRFAQNSIADSVWELFDINDVKWIKLLIDPIRKNVYIKIGDPNSNTLSNPGNPVNDKIYIANYYYGFDTSTIRWGRFRYITCPSINGMFISDLDLRQPGSSGNVGPIGEFNTLYPLLVFLNNQFNNPNYDAFIYSERIGSIDFDSLITRAYPLWIYETGFTPNKHGEIYTFGPLKLRIQIVKSITLPNDVGSITIDICGLDSSTYKAITTITPGELPGKYISMNLNFKGEQMRVRFNGSNRAFIQELTLYANESALDHPRA